MIKFYKNFNLLYIEDFDFIKVKNTYIDNNYYEFMINVNENMIQSYNMDNKKYLKYHYNFFENVLNKKSINFNIIKQKDVLDNIIRLYIKIDYNQVLEIDFTDIID